ncbi:hypothetical protein BKA61DRAFT_691881 [Leptodontidium sp. MPI-SDFR-AT-0119]|nr:hypothetical protein BKA61DRAFT_691881 [Leptodontidium sp. MPI-SDFR-AT-0119]
MVAFAFVYYDLKPLKINIRKPSSKLNNCLLGSRGSRAGSTYNNIIILHSDDKSEEDNNLGPGHARYTREEYLPTISIRVTYEHREASIGNDENGEEDSEEDDRTLGTSLDARLTSFTRSTPASEVTSLIELEVCLVLTDVDSDWDVRAIINEFEARIRAQRGVKRGGLGSNTKQKASVEAKALSGQ